MVVHGPAAPTPRGGKLVVSCLPLGESRMMSEALAVKLVIEGQHVHEIDGRSYAVSPGQMLIVDRGTPYRAYVPRRETARGLCLYLPARLSAANADEPLLGRALIQSTEATALGRFLTCCAELVHGGRRSELDLDRLLQTAGAHLDTMLSDATASMNRLMAHKLSTRREVLNRLECARAYLHAQKERMVPLDELARVAGMSGFQLTRYFSLVFGKPPGRYHRTIRLHHAAKRLREEDASVTEIALSAGYSEASAFSYAFVREFGHPPKFEARFAAGLSRAA